MNLLLLFAVGVIAGTLNVLAGGGSLLTLPVLLFLGLPAAMANGTNRIAILAQNIVAVSSFQRSGLLPLKISMICAPPALVGSMLGAELAVGLDDVLFRRILAGVILLVCIVMIIDPARRFNFNAQVLTRTKIVALAGMFFLIGFYGGFIQAGVGFLIITGLLIHGLDLVRINAVKVLVVGLFTITALGVFIWHGQVDWQLGLALAAGNAVGGWLGTKLAITKGHAWIRRLVMIVAVLFAIKLFW